MPTTPPGPSRRRLWAKRALALLCSIALTEGLLRVAFTLRVHLGSPPGCGTYPEIVGRLFYAYGGGYYSMLSMESDTTLPDAHRGYRLAPDLRNTDVSGAPVSTNSRGARGAREYPLPKPPSVVRVVALGDSLTFGEGVADDATWPAQLEGALPATEVVNLGGRGYAHDQMYFALLDDGMPLEPDAVILGFYQNDVWRDELTYYCNEKPRFSPGPAGWQVENVPVPSPREVRDRYLWLPLVYAIPRALFDRFTDPTMSLSGGEDRATEILRRIRQRADEAGARFLIVNLPDLGRPIPNRAENPDGEPDKSGFFYEYCAKTGAECVDTWPQFRAAAGTYEPAELSARFLRPHDMHYSRAGYAVVAEAIRRHLAEHPIARANPSTNGPVPTSPPP